MKIKVKVRKVHHLLLIKVGDEIECLPGFSVFAGADKPQGGAAYKPGRIYKVTRISNKQNNLDPADWVFWDNNGTGCYGRAIRKVVRNN